MSPGMSSAAATLTPAPTESPDPTALTAPSNLRFSELSFVFSSYPHVVKWTFDDVDYLVIGSHYGDDPRITVRGKIDDRWARKASGRLTLKAVSPGHEEYIHVITYPVGAAIRYIKQLHGGPIEEETVYLAAEPGGLELITQDEYDQLMEVN